LYFFLNHLEAQLSASLHIVASTPQIISPIKATKHTAITINFIFMLTPL